MYEIKVLDSNEFDEVAKSDPRYSYVDDTNLGFADREKGIAYVRGSNIHDLNKYLINHELEELEEEESTHQDPNGIRHKKGGFWKNLFDPVGIFHKGNILGIGGKQGITSAIFGGGDSGSGLLGNLGKTTVNKGDSGLQMSPFENFTVSGMPQGSSSQRISDTVTGGIQSGINQSRGIDGIQGLPPDLLQRLKGNYSGRATF